MKFKSTMHQEGNNTGIVVPADVIEKLNAGKKPPVNVTVNRYQYRSTVAVMGGAYMISFSSDHRKKSGIKGGDAIDVTIELDTAPRTVELPKEFEAALNKDHKAKAFFETLSNSQKKWHTYQIDTAKTDETRTRRIEKSLSLLREGKKI